jgi:hypothetical protein
MVAVERILCPADFSELSARPYDCAVPLGPALPVQAFFQHVLDFNLPSFAHYADATYTADSV